MKISYIKMIEYFFYKDYMFKKMIKHSDPLIVAAMMMSLVEFFNIMTLFVFLDSSYFHLGSSKTMWMFFTITSGIILLALNIPYFIKNEKRICDKYRGESSLKSILGYVFYVGYYIGSVALVIIVPGRLYHLSWW
jgi:hypothetical protein